MVLTYFICKFVDLRYEIKKNFYQRYNSTAGGTWLKIAMAIGVGVVFVLSTYLPDMKYAFSKVPIAVAFMAFAYFVN